MFWSLLTTIVCICVMSEIGDIGPEDVYCLHMWAACVLHFPKRLLKMCTLWVLLHLVSQDKTLKKANTFCNFCNVQMVV